MNFLIIDNNKFIIPLIAASLWQVYCTTPDKPGKAGFNVYKKCYDAGVNIKPTGDALIIAPPFVCEKKDIDEIIEKMREGITAHLKS